ncbi:nucleoporin Nup37 [Acipenser oxyrinchus oxyrinchus]|uniref:Nucleoporin Nup37 n=1 Tax=Acipenser oxyrinchus oxyrinchus TaxID=40147 RepID=A0AAD8DHT5_ACIOX|nr:nucleoporin Nup37 [Acipenser oxyrinchus oxyrinchus]
MYMTTWLEAFAVAWSRSASYTVECEDYVHVVEFSPFESGAAGALLAYGGNQYVVVGTCRFQEEDTEVDGIEYTTLRVFHHGVRVDAIAWSPESRLDALPKQIRFCTASADRKLRILTSDLQDRHEVKVMDGHSDYINDLVFDPREGQQIASVSDDHTCRIWDLDGSQKISFLLRSPGMSVCWHPEDAFKLMVAEKNGMVRFYDLITQQAILSLDCGLTPLMSADWCFANTIKVGAVAGNDWVIWDITRSSYPQEKRPAHVDRTRLFKWSKANENIFATTGCPGKINSQLLVHHLGHPQPIMIGSASVGAGLSWHRTLPLCVIGGDRKLSFWMTEM